ncbi:unnamed protein product [Fusarium graminearum]|uniref:Chromosome 2, complete genome n=1 Tax=Gibberella zeae (strain ATCC MYA-4620 / CBS 123657 / FGSC 9075 / NRRL 31084 / PH-1) TaxID=229533 RepID=A0A098DN16_GIBZE|nr:unnamed protein product [Fusarium graminearum]CZS83140.1 unnamed protein product [Fusarium graminearum]
MRLPDVCLASLDSHAIGLFGIHPALTITSTTKPSLDSKRESTLDSTTQDSAQ